MNLAGLWQNSYYTWNHRLEPWTPGMEFDAWWQKAKHDFDDSRATSFYRYQLPAFTDLYGVDFETLTDEKARELDDQIFENYKDSHLAAKGRHRAREYRADVQRPILGSVRIQHRLPLRGPRVERHNAGGRLSPLRVQGARGRPVRLRGQARG